jgi:hypothetical protein
LFDTVCRAAAVLSPGVRRESGKGPVLIMRWILGEQT